MGEDKKSIRHKVWEQMAKEKVGVFPFKNRIPNFKGAEESVEQLKKMITYQQAKTVMVSPYPPQLPVRSQVLTDKKTLIVPTPQLQAGFLLVKPGWVPQGQSRAASISHILNYGVQIPLSDLPVIDMMIVGSVAVQRDGRHLGTGEGYADREYAILREVLKTDVPVITNVHSAQVVDDDIPKEPFDISVDWIITEKELIATDTPYDKPSGIIWNLVTDEEKNEIPVLQEAWRLTHQNGKK